MKYLDINSVKNIKDKINLSNIDGFIKFSDLKKTQASYFLLKAVKEYKNKNYDLACVYFKKINKIIDDSAYIKFKIGMCYYKKGDWVSALVFFEESRSFQGYKKSWDIQYYSAKKNINKKIGGKIFKERYLNNPNLKKNVYDYANFLFDNKKYWLSINTLNKYLEDKIDGDLLFLKGLCFVKLSNFDEAIKIFNNLVYDEYDNNEIYYYLGLCHDFNNEYDFAKLNYMKFNNNVADYHLNKKYYDLAIKYYHYDLLDGKNEVVFKLANAYYLKCEYNLACKFYEQGVSELNYTSAGKLYKYAKALERSGELKKSLSIYNESLLRENNVNTYIIDNLENLNLQLKYKDKNSLSVLRKGLSLISGKSIKDESTKRKLYVHYFENLNILENFILFESNLGENITCNPYAILLECLSDKRFNNYRFVIVLNDEKLIPSDLKDHRIIFIQKESESYYRYLCSCKYLINNITFPFYFIRRDGQRYLNTWHGTPIKYMGKDVINGELDNFNIARNFLQTTHLISHNDYTNHILLNKYDVNNIYSGKVATTGYPRIDLIVQKRDKVNIIENLDINDDKPIVLYAPTWRGDISNGYFDSDKLISDLEFLSSEKYHLLFKCHRLAEKSVKDKLTNVKVVPSNLDINDILSMTDILISDYSSIIFDYMVLNKPIISYVYDFESYNNERGLYFSKDNYPGEIAYDINSVKEKINNFLGDSLEIDLSYQNFSEIISYKDGKSTSRVIDFFFEESEEFILKIDKKKVNLIYGGNYGNNGITTSFLNLMKNLKNEKVVDFQNIIIVDRSTISGNFDSKNNFINNFNKDFGYLGKVGNTLYSTLESEVKNTFDDCFKYYNADFKNIYNSIYEREVKRLLGNSSFENVINFDGYSVFWTALLSNVTAKNKIIYQHNDLYLEWYTKYPSLEGVFGYYEHYDKVISVSKGTMENNAKNLNKEFNIEVENFDYVNNSIVVDEIIQKSVVYIEHDYFEFKGNKILNIGRLSHEKDHHKLISAFYKSGLYRNNTRLYIMGDGPLRDDLSDLIKLYKLEGKVILLGQIPNPYPFLKKADLFVLSSNHEGQPMVLLEALTLGTPILASDIVGNRSILNEYEHCLFANSEEALIKEFKNYNFEKKIYNIFDSKNYNRKAMDRLLSILN